MPSSRQGFTFWGTVVAVWTALRLKKEYDDYRAISSEDGFDTQGGRGVQLPQTPRDVETAGGNEDDVSLLDTNIRVRREKKKPAACCMCCGVDCTLFWKAFGFVLVLWTLFGIFKGIRWALTPTPSGLEGMPTFGQNLGCDAGSVFYKDAPEGYLMSVAAPADFHDLKIQGAGAGTLTITSAPSSAGKNVSYSITMRGTDQPLLDMVKMELSDSETGSKFAMLTPTISRADRESGNKCIKFDIIVSIPPTLKQFHILSYSTLQVKYDDSAHLDLERLSVVTMSPEKGSLILPNANFHAGENYLETYNGYIVGDVALDESAVIDTQRGDGVAHVKLIQSSEHNHGKNVKARLQTATGSGRSEFTYIADKKSKRTIDSRHISARNGDVYLKYEGANFNGKIAMASRSSAIHGVVTGLKAFGQRVVKRDDTTEWTHTRGNAEGSDTLRVESNGWTGLWF